MGSDATPLMLLGRPASSDRGLSARSHAEHPGAHEGVASEEHQLEQVAKGDRLALVALYRSHSTSVRRVAQRILQDDGEADDLLQDLFILLFRKASLFDPKKGSARSWIIQMAYQQALQRRRYLSRRNFYRTEALDLDRHQTETHGHLGEPTFLQLHDRELLGKYRDVLSEEQQRVLNLHFFEGYDLTEISGITHQAPSTVRSHLFRALKRLRAELMPNGKQTHVQR